MGLMQHQSEYWSKTLKCFFILADTSKHVHVCSKGIISYIPSLEYLKDVIFLISFTAIFFYPSYFGRGDSPVIFFRCDLIHRGYAQPPFSPLSSQYFDRFLSQFNRPALSNAPGLLYYTQDKNTKTLLRAQTCYFSSCSRRSASNLRRCNHNRSAMEDLGTRLRRKEVRKRGTLRSGNEPDLVLPRFKLYHYWNLLSRLISPQGAQALYETIILCSFLWEFRVNMMGTGLSSHYCLCKQ